MMKKVLFGVACMRFALLAQAAAPVTVAHAIAANDRVVLPLQVVSGFAFVEGEVNGLRGVFMLDTGTPYSLFLNNSYLKLAPKKEVSRGSASSGQKIIVSEFGCLDSLSIATRYTLPSQCDLKGTDLGFVAEELHVPLLGFIGIDFFAGHRLMLDWAGQRASIESRAGALADGALTRFQFAAADRQVPKVTLTVGDLQISGAMDSGDPGHINLSQADAARLLASKDMLATREADGTTRYVVPSVMHDGSSLDTSELPVTLSDDASHIMLGSLFLKHYRSVWDYSDRIVTLYPASTQ